MADIQYNVAQLRARATEMRGYIASYSDAMDKLSNLVNGLPKVWSGTAETKLVTAFQQMLAGFDNMDDVLESYAKALEKSADNMESEDKRQAKKLKNV